MINVGGHFVSKQVGQLQYGGIHIGGGAPVPPPKPGSKGVGAGGAASAGRLGGGDSGKDGKGEGASEWSPLKGWYQFLLTFRRTVSCPCTSLILILKKCFPAEDYSRTIF